MVKQLFSNLFKQNTQAKPQQRADTGALNELSALVDEAQIVDFLNRHNQLDATSIELAISKVQSLEHLQQLAQHKQENVRLQAKQQLIQNLNAPAQLNEISQQQTLILLACYSLDAHVAEQAMQQINDEDAYFTLASTQLDAKVRLLAAQYITQPDNLQRLQKQFLNKDKALHQYCKQQLGNIKQQQEMQAQQTAQIAHSLEQMQRCLSIGYEPELKGKLSVLCTHWKAFTQQTPEQQQTFVQLKQELEQILQQHVQAQEQQAYAQAQQQQKQQQQQTIEQALSALSQRLETTLSAEDEQRFADLKQQIQDLDDNPLAQVSAQCQQIEQQISAQHKLQQQQTNIQQILQQGDKGTLFEISRELKKISEVQRAINWQANSLPESLKALNKQQASLQQQQQTLMQKQPELVRQYQDKLQELEGLIAQGKSKDVRYSHKQLQHLEQNLSSQNRLLFKAQAQQLKARVKDMQHWQNFALIPKKQALIEQMQKLCDEPFAVEVQAEKVKQLQKKWKDLGNTSDEKKLWEQFHRLSEQAFAPCKAQQKQQALQRADNLALRQQLTQQLMDYEAQMDWSQADWKMVQKTLEQAHKTFKQYSPVEHKEQAKSYASFKKAQAAIYAHLQKEYDKNLALKQQIVDKAYELAAAEDKVQAGEQAKALQQQWQKIGVCLYGPERALWNQFHAQCDIIFANIKQQIQHNKEQTKQSIEAFKQQLKQLQKTLTAPINQAQTSALEAIKQALLEADLPSGAQKQLLKQQAELVTQQQQLHNAYMQQLEQQKWHNLLALIKAFDAQQDINADAELPQGFDIQALQQAQQQAQENTAEAHKLCIHLEIIKHIDSPKDDQALRMQLQVERLAKGIGQSSKQQQEEQQILIEQWLKIKKSPEMAHRFYNVLAQK